jgi:antibiotic biosynthesis monooxygenase (ABM) superfamily enzyme
VPLGCHRPSSSAPTAHLFFLPVTARSLLLAFLLVIPMTYLVMPVMTRLFTLWLFSAAKAT